MKVLKNIFTTRLILFTCISGMLMAGCTEPATPGSTSGKPIRPIEKSSSAIYKLKVGDLAKKHVVSVGDLITVELRQCVGCAQVWTITDNNKSILAPIETTYKDKSCEDCSGGNITKVFHFDCAKRGDTQVTFEYFNQKVVLMAEVK